MLPSRVLLLLLVLFVWFTEDRLVPQANAQKNILYLQVDTMKISELPADVFLRIFYRLEAHRPTDFRGFYARLIYGPKVLVNAVDVITSGTASSTVDKPIETITNDEVRVAALGSIAFDTSNHVLFMIRFNVKVDTSQGTVAGVLWDELQLNSESGIDTIIYGDGFIKYVKPELPPRKDTVTVSLGADSVQHGEMLELPVRLSQMYGANVKQFALNFDFDTTVLSFAGAEIVDHSTPVTRVQQTEDQHVTVQVHSLDTTRIGGNSLYMILRFQTKERKDTVATYLTQLGFQALNSEATVTQVNFFIDTSIVYGKKEPVAVLRHERVVARVYPNPFRSSVRFEHAGEVVQVNLFDVLGREIFSASGVGEIEWQPQGLASGVYLARIRVRDHEQIMLLHHE